MRKIDLKNNYVTETTRLTQVLVLMKRAIGVYSESLMFVNCGIDKQLGY